jgi:hypothetical protein
MHDICLQEYFRKKQKMMNKNIKSIISMMLAFALVAGCFAIMAPTANAANTNANNKNSVTFTPHINLGAITWAMHTHSFFDGAFTEDRSPDPDNADHIQLYGDKAYFYGYYSTPCSDYMFYKESDSSEKIFKFSMLFSIYPRGGSTTPAAQYWHSMRSMGFLVNCIENDDGTVSGYYVSFEPRSKGDSIVLRRLNNVDFNALYDGRSSILSSTASSIVDEMVLGDSMVTCLYEIKSSYNAFSVMKDDEVIFTCNISVDLDETVDYNGGNDFGFYAEYVGSPSHSCDELSFAEFKDIELWTKSLVPDISEVSWNDGNGNGNGNGINQLVVNGITLKSSKNYVEPENFAAIAKTVLAKNDPNAIYTVIGKTIDNDDNGSYEKVYDIKIGLFEDSVWKVYSGLLSVGNPGRNEAVQPLK